MPSVFLSDPSSLPYDYLDAIKPEEDTRFEHHDELLQWFNPTTQTRVIIHTRNFQDHQGIPLFCLYCMTFGEEILSGVHMDKHCGTPSVSLHHLTRRSNG